MRIKVASYNIRKGIGTDRRRNPERVLEVLSEIGADVVALQECDRRFGSRAAVIPPYLLHDHGQYVAVPLGGHGPSMGWHGNGLLVPRDAQIIDHERLHLPALEPRGAVMADVRVNGAPIRVVGMHLDLSGLWRRRQAHAILHHVETSSTQRPLVMMGDLNEWSRDGGCLRDFARAHRFAPTGPSFHTRRPIGRLDRIIVSPDWRIVDCGVHRSKTARKASDHFPIWAVIEQA